MIIKIYFLLCLSVLAAEVNSIEFHPKTITVEPLLRFPFVHLLANPCGFILEHGDVTVERLNNLETVDQNRISVAPLRDVSKEIPLAKQVLDFLGPFRDMPQVIKPSRSMNDTKINEQSAHQQELKLVVSQALQLILRHYSPSALRKCYGFQLQSLSPEYLLVVSSTGEIQLEKLYRCLMLITAHLHVMIRDLYDSNRFCASENFVQLETLRQLTGKLETSMCLVLQSAAIMTESYEHSNYFTITAKMLQSYVHRYFGCSAREIRGCLVLRSTHIILNLIQRHFQTSTGKDDPLPRWKSEDYS